MKDPPAKADRCVLAERLGSSADVQAFERSWKRHVAAASPRLALEPGVVELLDRLDELRVPRAICTSSDHATVERNLALHGLRGRFGAVIAAGDYPRPKPAPDPFLRAAAALEHAPADCLAVEDSPAGVRAATAAGMRTVMIPDLLMPTDAIRALCWLVVSDLHGLRKRWSVGPAP